MSKLIREAAASSTANGDSKEREGAISPRVDVMETENEFLVLADIPGTKPDDVDIRFERGELSIHARRANRKEEFTTYHRTFGVADTVAADKIAAELKSGVLTIRLPKVEAVKPRKIAVNG